MPDSIEIQPVAPVPAPARPAAEAPAVPERASPAIVPSWRFVPSPTQALGQRFLDPFEMARLYAEVAQRNLIAGVETTRLTDPATRVSAAETTLG